MAKLRNAMLVAVIAAVAAAGIGGYFLLSGPPARLIVDASLAGALAVIITFMLSPTMRRVDMLVEALRALARGDKHQRVNPDDFAGLADVARALNEVAASLTEGEDPNLGPVRSTPRPGRPPRRELADPDVSEHPEIGPVRVHKKSEKAEKATESAGRVEKTAAEKPVEKAEKPAEKTVEKAEKTVEKAEKTESPEKPDAATSEPAPVDAGKDAAKSEAPRKSEPSKKSDKKKGKGAPEKPTENASQPPVVASSAPEPARDASARPESAAPTNDTAIDDGPPSDAASAEAEIAKIPSRAELEALFQEFVAAKKSKDESVVDLDLEAFAQTIQGECERLIAAHQCKGVRFEVTMADGEVSLRPRLLR